MRRCPRRSTAIRRGRRPARRCRRCGTGCISCRCTGTRMIGPDGHAKRGGFLPPVPLPRRMWAGSELTFHRPLRVGDAITRVSTIEDVTEKSGRSGPLVFVRVRHEIRPLRARTSRLPSSTTSSIAKRPSPAIRPAQPQAHRRTSAWRTRLGPRRRAAVPLFGAHVQRSPHPLRPPLRDRGRRLSRADRARAADRDVAARSVARPAADCARRRDSLPRGAAAVRHRIRSRSAASRRPTARRSSSWAKDHEGWLAMEATARSIELRE